MNIASCRRPSPWVRHSIAMAVLCATTGLAWGAPSATVLFASGDVRAISPQGQSRALQAGAPVESGETVQTGKGRVQLRMVDGAMMSLSEQTVLRLDAYHLAAPGADDERGFMSLVRGALRTISGSIGHPRAERYKLETPSGTIGIRGTEYTAAVGEGGLDVGVIGGKVAVCNDGGCVDVPMGFAAHTPSRSVRPDVSAKPLLHLQPANAAPDAAADATAPAATAPATPAWTPPVAGDAVSAYLAAALTPPATARPAPGGDPADETVLPSLPGSTVVGGAAPNPGGSVAPITIVPRPPAAAPSPLPVPGGGPAPAPNPTPGPTIPLSNGTATVGLVWATDKGGTGSGLTQGDATFDPRGGLLELENTSTGKVIVEKGAPTDVGADGVIAWGRWTDGKSKVKGTPGSTGVGNGDLATLHYFAIASTPTGPVSGAFTSFASTAPTVQSGGKLVAVGAANGASGSFTATLQVQLGGRAHYSLSVPVAGQTFSLAGAATQTSASGFSGVSVISSTGSACSGGCTGSFGNNVSVIGQIAGPAGNEAGVAYGFDSRIGNVSGVIVFKR